MSEFEFATNDNTNNIPTELQLSGQFNVKSSVRWMQWLPGMDLLAVAWSSSDAQSSSLTGYQVFRLHGRQQMLTNYEPAQSPTNEPVKIQCLTSYGTFMSINNSC
jgi:hypothetical protein